MSLSWIIALLGAGPAVAALTVSADQAAGVDERAPQPVSQVTAELKLDATGITVAWRLSADDAVRPSPAGGDFTSGGVFALVNDVAGYKIWRLAIGAEAILVGMVEAGQHTYVDDTIVTGEVYVYMVSAFDAADNESERIESGPVNLGPPPCSCIADEFVPSQSVRLTFVGELDLNNELEVTAFADDFITKTALLLSLDPNNIVITNISTGSIIVEFEIIGEESAAAIEVLAVELDADPEALNLENAGPVTDFSFFNSGEVDMGNVGIGPQLVYALDFTNDSEDPDAILLIVPEVSGAGFSVNQTSLTLAAGETASLDVIFTADDVSNVNGVYTGELVITTNDLNNRTTVITLIAEISQGLDLPVITVSSAFNFGQVALSCPANSRSLELTISNEGDLDLTGTLGVEGDAAFSVAQSSFTVAGGESVDIPVTFAPMAAVSYSGTIAITSNDANQPVTRVDLIGVGFDTEYSIVVCADPVTGEITHGDFDGNRVVNFDDFFTFADNFGAIGASDADFDDNGRVNFDDFFIFADNFGKSCQHIYPLSFSATIDASQVETASAGSGSAAVTLSIDETAVVYDISVTGLADLTAAHFHNAPAGSTGPVVHTLNFAYDGDGTWNATGAWTTFDASEALTATLVDRLKAGNIYINVHTTAVPAGEIRGQLLVEHQPASVPEPCSSVGF